MGKPQPVPSILFVAIMEITVTAMAWHLLRRRRRLNIVRGLAHEWGMEFLPADHFDLAEQVGEHLSTAGAAKLHAGDLVYRREGEDFFCAFTVSFTRGVLGAKHRKHQVAGVRQVQNEYSWIVAPAEQKLTDQYEYVRQRLMGKKEPDKV